MARTVWNCPTCGRFWSYRTAEDHLACAKAQAAKRAGLFRTWWQELAESGQVAP